MEIDLREIQVLHARYAREPVIIDLEAQVRARPAPLLLHDPNVRAFNASPLRQIWKARANVGRGALMVVGGTVLSAAIGMGAAQLWAKVHAGHTTHVRDAATEASAPSPASQATLSRDSEVESPARPLTSQDLGTQSGHAGALASVDPAALLRPAARGVSASAQGNNTSQLSDEQRAIQSPVRQDILERVAQGNPIAVAPMHIPPAGSSVSAPEPAQASPVSAKPVEPAAPTSATAPAPRSPVHHAARHRTPAPQQQPGAAAETKAAPAQAGPTTAPRGNDVQLF